MTTTISIRPAVLSERYDLEGLQWRASLSNPGDRDILIAHPDAIELPADEIAAGHVFVAERDGVILGFAAILPRSDHVVELDGLFVEPDLWKQGIGRALVRHCAAIARGQGAAALHVVGNAQAEGFYKSCGFEIIGPHETRFGPALLMRKILT
jgi:N-acetylglutamate synthase-like GNAT family acetyltransferase